MELSEPDTVWPAQQPGLGEGLHRGPELLGGEFGLSLAEQLGSLCFADPAGCETCLHGGVEFGSEVCRHWFSFVTVRAGLRQDPSGPERAQTALVCDTVISAVVAHSPVTDSSIA
jgi:hypothetical protein